MAERINLCQSVRTSLVASGYSSVRVVNAVNSAIGELSRADKPDKLGPGRASIKRGQYKVAGSVGYQLEGKLTMPLWFDSWHSAIEKAEKVAPFDSVAIPQMFEEWLNKMKEPVKSKEPDQAESVNK